MQMNLEHPEEKAKNTVHDRLTMNNKGEIELPEIASEVLTSESTLSRAAMDSPTAKFTVIMIDDNQDFLEFAAARLKFVYNFHVYNDIEKAAEDLEQIKCDLVVCKQDMFGMTGSDLCNQLKTNYVTQNMKFILMTDTVLTPQDMRSKNITLSADDYLAKPFNLQEATMRFNKVLGLGAVQMDDNLIEGAETRRLEGNSSSMTTATETMDAGEINMTALAEVDAEDPMNKVDTVVKNPRSQQTTSNLPEGIKAFDADEEEGGGNDFSMMDAMDRQLIKNIEQYVLQNMSRGQISLEEMANAMGMGRVPFFHRVRSLTSKTPAELVRDMRLKHACILLKRTNINMSELATNIGFMTAENFINIFKEKFGMTPLEYRLKHRK
jgi:AraC-like DNA-binding protein/DNA-binding response OmpR family regulator